MHRFSTPTFHGKCLLPANMTSTQDMLCSADEDFRRFPGLRFENPTR